MKRDWKLIRELLINVRDHNLTQFNPDWNAADTGMDWSFFDANISHVHERQWTELTAEAIHQHKAEVEEHLELMLGAGLIKGPDLPGAKILLSREQYKLTLRGYDLLEVMEKDAFWLAICQQLEENVLPVTEYTIMEMAKELASRKIKKL